MAQEQRVSQRRRPRLRWWLMGLGALVIVVAGAAWLLLRDAGTPTSLAEAVERFRGADDGSEGSAPPSGVYAMHTGGEEVIEVLGGLRHRYPATTPLIVLAEGCGTRWRWQPLEQRWDSWLTCPRQDGTQRLVQRTTYHEFVGRADERTYRCERDAVALPARLEVGVTFSGRCASEATELSGPVTMTWDGEVVGLEDVQVAGVGVPAARIRLVETLTGETSGNATTERWFALDDGRLLRERHTASTTSASFVGEVKRREHYDLRLSRLDPYR